MLIMLKMYAALGMLWSLVAIVLTIASWREDIPLVVWIGVAVYTALFVICWRCYCLQRIAALLVWTYCACISLSSWRWESLNSAYFWGVTTLILTFIINATWSQLKKGF